MAQTVLMVLVAGLQIYTLFVLHRITPYRPPDGSGEAKEKPRRFMTPSGIFAVESTKRPPKVNDDETLFEREQER